MVSAKRRGRSVGELYNATEVIGEPEMKSVVGANNPVQEPAVESEQDNEKIMVASQVEKRSGKRSMRQKVHTRVESGTCNVCAAPCSSCMHLKLAHMGSKDDESSDENGRVTATSQYSVNEGDFAPSCKNKACDSVQHATSEASNLHSVSSSHDSLSEVADSKTNIRASNIVEASLESGIPKLSSDGIAADDHRILLIKPENCKTEEGHDDNISCVSGANNVSLPVDDPIKNVDRKKLLHSSHSVSSLELEGSAKAMFPHKSVLSDTPSEADRGGSSSKVQNKCLPSDANVEHLEEESSFRDHEKAVKCPEEDMNPLLSKEAAIDIARNNFIADNCADALPHGGSILDGDNLKISSTVCPKSESEADKENKDQSDEALKCSHQVEEDNKSKGAVELAYVQDPTSQSLTGNESEESDILDVKVCDICGDAGREDLLAVCSRCSDGAEHTYCMREMLHEVPEGDWLCEECKSIEETEARKQGSDIEEKKTSRLSAQSSGKRRAENMEVSSAPKRLAIEASLGSPKPSSPGRMPSLSRDSSFKSLDKGKAKHAHPASLANHSSVDMSDIAHSSSTGPRLHTPKGTLLKSSSFSTLIPKTKVRLVDEVPQKHRSTKENSSDPREASGRIMNKSMSFKSVNSGSVAAESKVKMLSSKHHAHDLKRLKQVKDHSAFERKIFHKLDRPTSSNVSGVKVDQKITPRAESGTVSSTSNNRDLKTAQSDGKLATLSRSHSSTARRGPEIQAPSVRASSTNGMSNASVEQRLNQVSPKEEPSSSSSLIAERPSHSANENLQDVLPRSWESSNQDEKIREGSVTRLRPAGNAGSKNVACETCKEVGHAAEVCPMASSLASGTDAPTTRSVREEMHKGSKLKAAIEAAMLKKPGICRKKKEIDQSEGLSSTNLDANCEIASQEKISCLNKIGEVTHECPVNLGTCSSASFKQTDINNLKQLNVLSANTVFPCKVDLDPIALSTGKPSNGSTSMSVHTKISPIPEHEYIWQGAFEVRRAGKVSDLYGGIQAHLSTCASPKVLEVVKMFPQKITLDEVPRLSTWPRQFHDCGVREDNIALYFFAKDIESYARNYKALLDIMIQKDLAFKGSFDGVELFIFPSTQLPENSQRWNLLFFLWGVFKGRRSNCSDCLTSADKEDVPSAIMTSSENLSEPLDKEPNVCSSPPDVAHELDAPHKHDISSSRDFDVTFFAGQTLQQAQSSGFDSKSLSKIVTNSTLLHPEKRSSSPSPREVDPDCKRDAKLEPSTQETRTIGREEVQIRGGASLLGEDVLSIKNFDVCERDFGASRSYGVENVVANKICSDGGVVKVERNLNRDNMSMDAETSLERAPRKRQYLDLSKAATQTSGSTCETVIRNNIEGTLIEEENTCKKLKTGFGGLYGVSGSRDRNSLNDGFGRSDFGSSSSVVEFCDKAPEEKIILEDFGTTERYFFPVDSHHVKDFKLGANSIPWKEKSSSDNQILEVVPNLELALGADAKSSNKGALPFFVGTVDKNNKQNNNQDNPPDKVMDKEEENGVSASLSLSLSFPFPDKEPTVKPVPKTEQLVPEGRHVNTSLLLFGGLSDK